MTIAGLIMPLAPHSALLRRAQAISHTIGNGSVAIEQNGIAVERSAFSDDVSVRLGATSAFFRLDRWHGFCLSSAIRACSDV